MPWTSDPITSGVRRCFVPQFQVWHRCRTQEAAQAALQVIISESGNDHLILRSTLRGIFFFFLDMLIHDSPPCNIMNC